MIINTETLHRASMMIYKDGVDSTIEENKALVKLVEELIAIKIGEPYDSDYDFETGKSYLVKLLTNE